MKHLHKSWSKQSAQQGGITDGLQENFSWPIQFRCISYNGPRSDPECPVIVLEGPGSVPKGPWNVSKAHICVPGFGKKVKNKLDTLAQLNSASCFNLAHIFLLHVFVMFKLWYSVLQLSFTQHLYYRYFLLQLVNWICLIMCSKVVFVFVFSRKMYRKKCKITHHTACTWLKYISTSSCRLICMWTFVRERSQDHSCPR